MFAFWPTGRGCAFGRRRRVPEVRFWEAAIQDFEGMTASTVTGATAGARNGLPVLNAPGIKALHKAVARIDHRSLCTNCALIHRFQRIEVSFERKADSPICWKR